MLSVAQPPSVEMLEQDPALRRLEVRTRMLKYPFFASLALFAAAIVLSAAASTSWAWTDEVPDEASHAVLVADEIGGPLRAESFLDWHSAQKRIGQRVDLLGGEQKPVVVALVELEAEPEPADGWLVGI